jgi:sugar O-acyltransferase (sialic acid O-acetyltransferase NeuD family)
LSAEPLIIVCAGGYGRETAAAVQADGRWELRGFADDDPALWGREIGGVAVLGSPEEAISEAPEARVAVCQARPRAPLRRDLVSRLRLPPARYATIVHPAAWLAGSTSIGTGTVVLAGVVGTDTIEIGSHVAVMPCVVIVHDAIVEDYATLAAGVRLGGGVRIGSGAYVGMGALIRDGVNVGAGAVVGMGAVVTRSVPPGEIWFGSPARAHGVVVTAPARPQPAG